jgi:hypothetical protein
MTNLPNKIRAIRDELAGLALLQPEEITTLTTAAAEIERMDAENVRLRDDNRKLLNVAITARNLESFLHQNAGDNADWPIDIMARDDVAAETIKSHLQLLSDFIDSAKSTLERSEKV